MIAIACALLTALCFYISVGLGEQWYLVWLAPLPVLWLAFGACGPRPAFLAAWLGAALGASSLLRAYGGVLPAVVLVLAIGTPSLLFATAVMGARRALRRSGPVAAMFYFATLWAAFDFLLSFDSGGGTVGTPAAAEAGMPVLMQAASLVGFPGITFLLGLVPAGIAAALRTRRLMPLFVSAAFFAVNLGFGLWHMSAPPSSTLRVALVESDAAVGSIGGDNQAAADRAVDAYIAAIDQLDPRVRLVVLPENISRIAPAWRGEILAKFADAAERKQAIIVAGFNIGPDGSRRNISWAFVPGAALPVTYEKRALVPMLETSVYGRGMAPQSASGIGLEICKDMDYQAMLRSDEVATTPVMLAVPAWDFNLDDWSHARVAILRSVENGVPMARNARHGLLTLNDKYGRLLKRVKTVDGFSVVIGDIPLDGSGGKTFYDRIGDSFGWLCVALGAGFIGAGFLKGLRARD